MQTISLTGSNVSSIVSVNSPTTLIVTDKNYEGNIVLLAAVPGSESWTPIEVLPPGSHKTIATPDALVRYKFIGQITSGTASIYFGSTAPTTFSTPPFMRIGFAEVGSGLVGKALENLQLIQVSAGMTVSQAAGNLNIVSGTAINEETVIRSRQAFTGSLLARLKVILSQRIANNTFRAELADLIGESLAYTINSATSVTVTFPAVNPFTSENVGQSIRLSCITGAAGIPGRYAIASVSGLTVTFTVAAWPASGSGTLTLYGWNWIALTYDGTTATAVGFDSQRRGWNSGVTSLTISTTASPGHVAQLAFDVHTAGVSDGLVASNSGFQWTPRGSRIENIPDPDIPMYLFLVAQNGSTAPASTTTWTIGFVQIEDQGRHKVRIASADPSSNHALPVYQINTVSTVTANIGTSGVTQYTDSSTVLAASAAFTGTSRDSGATPAYNIFVANAYADQSGTLEIQKSTDASTWRPAARVAVAAGVPAEISVRCTTRYYRVLYTNGATLQTAFLLTSAYQRI